MTPFQQAQLALAAELRRLGIETEVAWRWDHAGWSPAAPNGGARWTCSCSLGTGRGDTGEEAMRALTEELKKVE